jgi:hypothetical protein
MADDAGITIADPRPRRARGATDLLTSHCSPVPNQ